MATLIALFVIAGLIVTFWALLDRKDKGGKVRSKDEPRGRSLENRGGTGSRSRSSSLRKTFTRSSKNKVVRRVEKPYWKRRGWKKENGNLIGYYRTKYGNYKGKIENFRSNPEVYIYNPPKQLRNHDHSSCFFHQGGSKYKVHFKGSVQEPSLAIQNVEKILRESFRQS